MSICVHTELVSSSLSPHKIRQCQSASTQNSPVSVCVHTKLASVSLLVQTKHANFNQHSHKTAPMSICVHTKHTVVGLLVQTKTRQCPHNTAPMSVSFHTKHANADRHPHKTNHIIVNLRPHKKRQCQFAATVTKRANVNLRPREMH